MGRFEGTPWNVNDVGALLRLYSKYRDIWLKTYGKRVQDLLKAVVDASKAKKILVLGAGTPIRFPEDLDDRMTVVDRSPQVKELWEQEERRARFILDDVVNAARNLTKGHDIIVLPAILSWLPEEKRIELKNILRPALEGRKVILAYDTTHQSTGYHGTEKRASQVLPADWHDRYIGGPRRVLPCCVWTVVPRPIATKGHIVDPGEEWGVEASIHGPWEVLDKIEPKIEDIARAGYKDWATHSKDLRKYVELKHGRWAHKLL